MKAPDKIYIQQDMINNIPLEEKEFDDDVEYIQKSLYDKLKEKYDTLESGKPMQDGLEEEINRLWESFADEMEGPHNLFDVYARLARHFAEWGAEHLKK